MQLALPFLHVDAWPLHVVPVSRVCVPEVRKHSALPLLMTPS